jgi:ARG and Rhodanese-Phosphatase-superfamily-associated Protein domain
MEPRRNISKGKVMTAINDALQAVTLGEAQSFENLTITPLLAATAGTADYLTLSEAQDQGLTVVTEVSDSGSVPTLLLENTAEQSVFLLDGEELVGAKQNRILNLTLLVPAKTKMEIPVSCVEQGRWSHRTEEFAPTERAFFSKGRARKAARVSENLREVGSRGSNQGEVWGDIGDKMVNLKVNSSTDAIADAYEHFSGSVDEYVGAFSMGETQVGACFAINGKIRGVELFDVSATCGKLMPKLIRSYALDAIEECQASAVDESQSISGFIQSVAVAPADIFDALGEGEDIRIRSNDITGGALSARDRVIHLCAFAQEAETGRVDDSGRMQRASMRQRNRRRQGAPRHDTSEASANSTIATFLETRNLI